MNTYLNTLFNNGNNDGEILIKANDSILNCHAFIIKYCTTNKLNINDNTIDMSNYNKNQISYILRYMYNSKIEKQEMSNDDIINIFKLINELGCNDFITILKNDLTGMFLKNIKLDNWFKYFDMLYGDNNYKEINEKLLEYYNDDILNNNLINENSIDFLNEMRKVKNDAVYDLLISTIKSIIRRNTEPLCTNLDNEEVSMESVEEIDRNGDENDNESADEYNTDNIIKMLKNGHSFKQISDYYEKVRDEVIIDFFKHINSNDKAKTVDAIIKKYNILLSNDKTAIKKLKQAQQTSIKTIVQSLNKKQ
ncbi:hypothetical protein Indivirus_3_77 [Indivirus ILV1]|uniref:BTB domain-containing protein n=1 Tax=Indivirus ILV1 TaxID=1977633 RepID=A0A1V0SDU4_9VIRU|nr:hypothetical protein Indivirus_3_77 [Indivirus ILV1]